MLFEKAHFKSDTIPIIFLNLWYFRSLLDQESTFNSSFSLINSELKAKNKNLDFPLPLMSTTYHRVSCTNLSVKLQQTNNKRNSLNLYTLNNNNKSQQQRMNLRKKQQEFTEITPLNHNL